MNRSYLLILFMLLMGLPYTHAQKKPLDHEQFDEWNSIRRDQISPNGEYVIYHLAPGKGDHTLKIKTKNGQELLSYQRAEDGDVSWDSKYVAFMIKPAQDSINELRRKKVKKDEMPNDSLGIYNLETKNIEKIADVRSFKMPEEWTGWIFYYLDEPVKVDEKAEKDTTENKEKKKPSKKVNDKNGFHLIVKQLGTSFQDTLEYVTDYEIAKKGAALIFHTTGRDSTVLPGVYSYDFAAKESNPLTRAEGKYKALSLDMSGRQAAFLSDLDTTDARIRPYQLRYTKTLGDSAQVVIDSSHDVVNEGWMIPEFAKLRFSENGQRLYFHLAPEPVLQDTTLLPEEIIDIEIWSYKDQRLHTQQNIEAEGDKKKGYLSVLNTQNMEAVQLATEEVPEIMPTESMDGNFALGYSNENYLKFISWEGFPARQDLYVVDVNKGSKELIKEGVKAYASVSPAANYIYWYSVEDTAWYSYSIKNKRVLNLTENIPTSVANELNDVPDFPNPYGLAGWTEDDEHVLIYDRFDIWKVDPSNPSQPVNLTQSREKETRFRYINLDRDVYHIDPDEDILLMAYNEDSRKEGYFSLDIDKPGRLKELIYQDFSFGRPQKAALTDDVIFTKESYQRFPDLLYSSTDFKKITRLSNANPQQKDYKWGSVEIVSWTSLDGEVLEGLLFKPENFDPNKQYPMMTYFYETYSNRFHNHWGMGLYRSFINFTFYASRGYLVFVPDITYRTGYPGQSAYNDVIPGVTMLINKGFVDKENIGVQGHSWGGYQSAYLITQTNIFAAAESGAPVSNMTSAYGGIRWWTGLSRMFQYEHTQSRIGGNLWEKPLLYIENSPLFYLDKVQTPLLIMHNDKDGHVPWYQGIELFVSMRRLGKPAWMLNYVGEPHWPTSYQNMRDFQIRMQQFFDHYLKDEPMPKWMKEGIPATLKGIDKGYELMEE